MPDLKERLAELRAKHRAFLDGKITDQELMTDVLLEWDTLLKLGELAVEMRNSIAFMRIGGCGCKQCLQADDLIARYDALEAGK